MTGDAREVGHVTAPAAIGTETETMCGITITVESRVWPVYCARCIDLLLVEAGVLLADNAEWSRGE